MSCETRSLDSSLVAGDGGVCPRAFAAGADAGGLVIKNVTCALNVARSALRARYGSRSAHAAAFRGHPVSRFRVLCFGHPREAWLAQRKDAQLATSSRTSVLNGQWRQLSRAGAPRRAPRAAMGFQTASGGDSEGIVRFETPPKCLKSGHPILRGPIRGTPDLRLSGVPCRPYGQMRPELQTLPPGLEANGPSAVPDLLSPFSWRWPRPHRARRTFLRTVGCHYTQRRAFWRPTARETYAIAYGRLARTIASAPCH